MKILITGGAGYLGSILSAKMVKAGHHVRIIDNLMFGRKPIISLLDKKNFELFKSDIRDLKKLTKAIADRDIVIHLAAIVGDQACDIDSKTTMIINNLATKNIAELCSYFDVKKLIFASTCTVYGVRPGELLTENQPAKPFSLYGKTKYWSEKAILKYRRHYKPVIMRMGTLFGLSNRMRFDLAVNYFIAEALKNKKITVFGGEQYRPFIHVDDAAQAFMAASDINCQGIFNLGHDNISIKKIAQIIKKKIPCEVIVEKEIQDKRNYQVSWAKARKILKINNKKDIIYATFEIKKAFKKGQFADYPNGIYNNFKHIIDNADIRRKVYTEGLIFNGQK